MSLASLEQAIPAGDLLLLDTTTVASYFKGNEAASPVATYVVDQNPYQPEEKRHTG